MIKIIKNLSFRQAVIMEVSLHVYVRIVEKRSRLVNLDIEIWETEILEINHSVKVVDEDIVRGTEMSNFIQSLDYLYDDVRSKNNISLYNKKFALYIPIKVEMYGRESNNGRLWMTNPQDINISFVDLLILINLILAKDMVSAPLWTDKPNFLKHTISKYILLLRYYYYKDEKAKLFLESTGFDVEGDIYSNYDTQEKRNAKLKIFCDFDSFEKSGIIC